MKKEVPYNPFFKSIIFFGNLLLLKQSLIGRLYLIFRKKFMCEIHQHPSWHIKIKWQSLPLFIISITGILKYSCCFIFHAKYQWSSVTMSTANILFSVCMWYSKNFPVTFKFKCLSGRLQSVIVKLSVIHIHMWPQGRYAWSQNVYCYLLAGDLHWLWTHWLLYHTGSAGFHVVWCRLNRFCHSSTVVRYQ